MSDDKPLKYMWMQSHHRFGRITQQIKEMIAAIELTGTKKAEIIVTSPDVEKLRAAAKEVCEDHDLAHEDFHGKIDRLREALANVALQISEREDD